MSGTQRHQADLPDDGPSPSTGGRRFGATELPPDMQRVVKKAVALEWVTLGMMVVTITAVGIVMGSSQASCMERVRSWLPVVR